MIELKGKSIIFTDLHCGLCGNRGSRLRICATVIKNIADAIERDNVKNVIFGGDWFHSRTQLSLETLNIGIKLVSALAKRANVILIVGNHDCFMKNSTDINSLNVFRDTPNVKIVTEAESGIINGETCLFVPWASSLDVFEKSKYDMAIGHFDVSTKYLVQSYKEEHAASSHTDDETLRMLNNDSMLSKRESSDMVGNFVEVVKPGGCLYAGHIHMHKEFVSRGRDFVFVGSPYEQNTGDAGNPKGYYLLDDRNNRKFIELTAVPKHVFVSVKSVMDGKFDFKLCAGNIVQKIYDIEISQADEARLNQSITDMRPYEELPPEYRVAADYSGNTESSESIKLIRKSKLDYMKAYVNNISDESLNQQGVNRESLISVLSEYYEKITGDNK